jgi:hypothetical protein
MNANLSKFDPRDFDHRNYDCSAVHPDYVLAGKGANYAEVLFEVTSTTGDYGCSAAHPDYVGSE